jgi:hypothetical protein
VVVAVALALVVALAVAVSTGFAANLGGLGSGGLGAGAGVVPACDTNGFTVSYATAAGNVTSVNVGGIADPACEGGRLSVALVDGGTSLATAGPTTVPTDAGTTDNSVSMAVSPQPAVAQLNRVHVSITGP